METQRWYHYLALQATNAAADLNRFLNAAFKTLRLESSSGPYLLNVSTALLWSRRGSPLEQAKFLEIVLKTTSLSGAENLIGSFWDSFYTRWHRAVAEGNPRVEWLWAEAHIRLGQLDFQAEKFSRACEHFEQAEALDPENTNGMLSMAKALWQVDRRKAVQYLRERIHRLPLDTAAHLFLLEILVKEGFDNEAARVQYETIRMLNMMKGTLES